MDGGSWLDEKRKAETQLLTEGADSKKAAGPHGRTQTCS